MTTLLAAVKQKYAQNKKLLWFCVIITYVSGLLAHGYMFLNHSISHDSLSEFILSDWVFAHKIGLGRIFFPFYKSSVVGIITIPWLVGAVSLLYISITAFMIVRIFRIKSPLFVALTIAVLTINRTTISTFATYITDADCDMLALLFSVLSAYLLINRKKGWLWGIVPSVCVLGFYQAYTSVTLTLIVMLCICGLLAGGSFREALHILIKTFLMLLCAGAVYILLIKLTPLLTGIEMSKGKYNSLDAGLSVSFKRLIYIIITTYTATIKNIISPFTYNMPVLNIFFGVVYGTVILIPVMTIVNAIRNKTLKGKELLLAVILTLALPFAMNISRILSGGMSHDLMHYALWLAYISPFIASTDNSPDYKRIIPAICLIVGIFFNIRTANQIYIIKNLAYDSNLSLMTRVAYELENQELYIPNETPVAFIGEPEHLIDIDAHRTIPDITGLYKTTSVLGAAQSEFYDAYFKNILNLPIAVLDNNSTSELSETEAVIDMPVYPDEGSIIYLNGVYVVKMGCQ